jgi:hypothetical protein
MEKQDEISWNNTLEDMIAQEGEKCSGLAWLYGESERFYEQHNNWIALPVIILSTVTGFISGSSQLLFPNPTAASVGVGLASLATGVLSTVGSYFAWAKKTEGCRISALQYSKLQKFIAIEMSLPKNERIQAKDMLKMIRETAERLMETSPAIPIVILERYKEKFSEDIEIAHPEITNGIHKLTVNRVELQEPPKIKIRIGV